jgi:hypothetical protein
LVAYCAFGAWSVTKHRNVCRRVVGNQASLPTGRRNVAKVALMSVFRPLVTPSTSHNVGHRQRHRVCAKELENPKNHGYATRCVGDYNKTGESCPRKESLEQRRPAKARQGRDKAELGSSVDRVIYNDKNWQIERGVGS